MEATDNVHRKTVMRPTRNWLELPSDLMVNILHRIGVLDILENAENVCTVWHEICKEPALWRVIHLDRYAFEMSKSECQEMCKYVVDRSQGQLVDLTLIGFCNDKILHYVADRSSQLKRLEVDHYYSDDFAISSEPFKKLLVLEELSLIKLEVPVEFIKVVGRYCPLLKTLKVNQQRCIFRIDGDGMALTIGKNLPELTHLELSVGKNITNTGLKAILDGCRHLETLDLRLCACTDLNGELGKRCSQRIKNLKLSIDSLGWCPHIHEYAVELSLM